MSESVSEENDRRSSRKAAALLCLLLLFALFPFPEPVTAPSSPPCFSDPSPSLAAWSADFSEKPDVQALPRDLRNGSSRTMAPLKLKLRPHLPLRTLFSAEFRAAAAQKDNTTTSCGRTFAKIPALSDILNDSVPVRAGPVVARPVSSLPALS
ncbi:MAG: hypothetical protein L6W00_29195 [Lentisphaeria bacterium]|nr:MAG: hypothetical protein L6W00_29195 [Lentisphaeria bacterium]